MTPLHSAPSCQDHGLHSSRRDATAGWAWAACPGCALPAVDSWGQPAACEPVCIPDKTAHLATVPRLMPSWPLSSLKVCWAPPGAHICSFPVPCTHSSAPLLPARAHQVLQVSVQVGPEGCKPICIGYSHLGSESQAYKELPFRTGARASFIRPPSLWTE